MFSNASSSGSLLCIASLLWGLRTLLKLCLNVFLASLSLFSYANALLARITHVYINAFLFYNLACYWGRINRPTAVLLVSSHSPWIRLLLGTSANATHSWLPLCSDVTFPVPLFFPAPGASASGTRQTPCFLCVNRPVADNFHSSVLFSFPCFYWSFQITTGRNYLTCSASLQTCVCVAPHAGFYNFNTKKCQVYSSFEDPELCRNSIFIF